MLLVSLLSSIAVAQDFNRYNFNVGAGPSFPIGDTNDVSGVSGNFVAGGGLNFAPALGFSVEYMYNGLAIDDRFAGELGVPEVAGHMHSVTGNLIVKVPPGKLLEAYLIGGGGWYRRTVEATASVLTPGTVYEPSWAFWGVVCVNGLVPATVTLGSRTSDAGGWNIGGGVTFGHSAKFYTEVRYHRAYHDNVDTEALPVTFVGDRR